MTARNKYIVTHSLNAFQSGVVKEKIREVYADEVKMIPTGDAVFHQVRDSAVVNDQGERTMQKDMALVLVLRASVFESIHLATPGTSSEAYKESGQVQLSH